MLLCRSRFEGTSSPAEMNPAENSGARTFSSVLFFVASHVLVVALWTFCLAQPAGLWAADDNAADEKAKAADSTTENQTSDENASSKPADSNKADEADNKETEAKKDEEKPAVEEPKKRLITVSGNRTTLNVAQWPLIGKQDAKYLFVEMFDYSCPHCRATHHTLEGAMERFGDDLAVIALPVPMDGSCHSPNLASHSYNSGSCEVARLAVAVWRVDPPKFKPFHSWLFASSSPRNSTEARQEAARLVGEEALQKELAQPWAGKYIAKHVELYQRAGGGSVPKLLFPKATISGEPGSTDNLCELIRRELEKQ